MMSITAAAAARASASLSFLPVWWVAASLDDCSPRRVAMRAEVAHGDEGREAVTVVGPRMTGINEKVAAASDEDRAALDARTSDMLDFG